MLIRYRTNGSITAANLMSDIDLILTGQISSVNDFSSGCDKANSSVSGTYPENIYTSVQANSGSGTYTYSKVHNDYPGTTHYFRMVFNTTEPMLRTMALAQGWNSGSSTLVNSQAMTKENIVHGVTIGNINEYLMNVANFSNPDATLWGINNGRSNNLLIGDRVQPTFPYQSLVLPVRQTRLVSQLDGTTGQTGNYYINILQRTPIINYPCTVFRETSNLNAKTSTYDSYNQKTGIDFVITDKSFFINWPTAGICHGVFDLGKNGVTDQYNSSMLMGMLDLRAEFVKIPYYYKLSTSSYGSIVDVDLIYDTPTRMRSSNQSITVIENPITGRIRETGNPMFSIYGINRISDSLVPGTVYAGPASVNRVVPITNYSLITE